MKITWLGHSAFLIKLNKSVLLFDPFITQNPKAHHLCLKDISQEITHIVLTHGHLDHIGDTLHIVKDLQPFKKIPIIANADLGSWLSSQGASEIQTGNTGGTLKFDDFCLTFTQAIHSSAFLTEKNISLSLGSANGIVIHPQQGQSVYHMGDTDIFSDMALINELHQPDIGLVPIGDCYTMGGAVAALACRRYFSFKSIIPCHYATFDVLDPNADLFLESMKGANSQLFVPKIGEDLEF